jgi:peroxiredoxin Q/BCP
MRNYIILLRESDMVYPGTTQACLFRDSYEPLTAGGLAIYGLSTDSPKSNTSFKEKQNLPYPLLCDPSATLIDAIGLKKAPKGTTRGVFVVDKAGKVLLAEPGGPAATVDAVKKLVGEGTATETKGEPVVDKPLVEEAKPTNGDIATEKKPEEAVQDPVE